MCYWLLEGPTEEQ